LENKSIGAFFAQGSFGGAIGGFLFTVFSVLYLPNFYNFLLAFILPIPLAYGIVIGGLTGMAVWLGGVLLRRRNGFLLRVFLAIASQFFVFVVFSVLQGSFPKGELLGLGLVCICLSALPVGLVAGSDVSPWRLIFFGFAPIPRNARRSNRVLFSLSAGLLLRLASVFGLLQSLFWLALWASYLRIGPLTSPLHEDLFFLTIPFLYFGLSAYASFGFPRKSVLFALAALLNLPLLVWLFNSYSAGTPNYLAPFALLCVCLWLAHTIGRLIDPRPADGKRQRGVKPSQPARKKGQPRDEFSLLEL
jgi:hypothetical protein